MNAKERLEQLRAMEKARTDMAGKPLSGYATNVGMIREEIKRLEAEVNG